MFKKHIQYLATILLFVGIANAQSVSQDVVKGKAPINWYNLDQKEDNILGVSTEKAYKELLLRKKSRTVVVAVIDSGVDINHEDLQGKIWTNPKEIAGNGQDDDKNGYVDDLNGWDFIGGKDGKDVIHDSMELTRQLALLSKRFNGKTTADISASDKAKFQSDFRQSRN